MYRNWRCLNNRALASVIFVLPLGCSESKTQKAYDRAIACWEDFKFVAQTSKFFAPQSQSDEVVSNQMESTAANMEEAEIRGYGKLLGKSETQVREDMAVYVTKQKTHFVGLPAEEARRWLMDKADDAQRCTKEM